MRNRRYYIAIDEYEREIIINNLNTLQNKLIANSRYTDAVDDILVKVAYIFVSSLSLRVTPL